MNNLNLTIITVNYNSRKSIEKSIQVLHDPIKNEEISYIVVDNSNDSELKKFIGNDFSNLIYIKSPGNVGYGRGCNIGLEKVNTSYCLLLNPDALLSIHELKKMISFMEDNSKAAYLGPCIHEPNGTLQWAGGLPTPLDILKDATGLGTPYPTRREISPGFSFFKTDWLCAAIILVRMKVIDEIGGFDPRYFLYFEETDLCNRLLRAGWEIWGMGEAEGYHQNAGSAVSTSRLMYNDCIAEHYFQSRFYYMVKFYGWPLAIIADIIEYITSPVRWLYSVITKRPGSENYITRIRSPLLSLPKEKS
jgi:GT2 family glycosyltransferase